jgi:hypothetical protein
MKHTKLMLAGITTFILTWLFIATVGYLLSNDYTIKQCLTSVATIWFMLMFGWLPIVPVLSDLDKKYGL